jgi:hypothetical protein
LSTLTDVLASVKKLKEEADRLEVSVARTNRSVDVEKTKLKSFIEKIRKELRLGASDFFDLWFKSAHTGQFFLNIAVAKN